MHAFLKLRQVGGGREANKGRTEGHPSQKAGGITQMELTTGSGYL